MKKILQAIESNYHSIVQTMTIGSHKPFKQVREEERKRKEEERSEKRKKGVEKEFVVNEKH